MTTIILPPEVEVSLKEAARQQGTSPELLAVACLRQRYGPDSDADNSTSGSANLAEFLGDYVGAIQSGERIPGGAQMSKNSGEKFTELLLSQQRQRGRDDLN